MSATDASPSTSDRVTRGMMASSLALETHSDGDVYASDSDQTEAEKVA
jgi:hypothetical protein